MIAACLIAAFRHLIKHKAFTAINLTGLATGMTACFFAMLYVGFELSYDGYHENKNNIYRLVTDVETSSGIRYESTSAPMAQALKESFPEVREAARVLLDYMMIQRNSDIFSEEKIAYADGSVFSVFTLPLVSGDAQTVLATPFTVVLSETASKKYFGHVNPVGKNLILDRDFPAVVTGVMKDMPFNSHFRVDILVSISTLLKEWNPSMAENWRRFGFYTYLLLSDGATGAGLTTKLPAFVQQHMDQTSARYKLSLEPLGQVYLHGKARGHRAGSAETGAIQSLLIFSLVAGFVLFIACFNFVNLTTALSVQRTKEVGVRKVLGASKYQLVFQFLTDAILLSLAAFLISLIMSSALLPFFNQFSGKTVSAGIFEEFRYVGLLFFIALAAGVLSGVYPAFFLSKLSPVKTLNGSQTPERGKLLRQSLVVLQFTLAIALAIATISIYKQLHFMQYQNLGFDHAQKLILDFYFNQKILPLKRELSEVPGVEAVSVSSCIPGRQNHTLDTRIENSESQMQDLRVDAYFVDEDFLELYEIKVVFGRAFSKDYYSDSTQAMIINEKMVQALGFSSPEAAIGKRFSQGGNEGVIIGVVKNFHTSSFHREIQPLTFQMAKGRYTFFTFQLSESHVVETVAKLEERWRQLAGGIPFYYFFADDAYNAQYRKEERFSKLFVCFSALAILLSCLGLIGLSAFSVTRRTKEISIRKVLGSSVLGIMQLLMKEFVLLMIIASMAGIPLGWMAVSEWLSGYAYRINLSWWIFATASAGVFLVACIALSVQLFVAALADPVKSLKMQ